MKTKQVIHASNPTNTASGRFYQIQNGFTSIQLVMTIVIIGIMSSMAVPAYANVINNQRILVTLNSFHHTVYSAKFEANKTTENVVICPSQDGENCFTDSYDYSYGWILFINSDKDYPVVRDPDEELLQSFSIKPGDFELIANRKAFTFKPIPRRSTNGTLMLCPLTKTTKNNNYQALIISYTGRPRNDFKPSDKMLEICS